MSPNLNSLPVQLIFGILEGVMELVKRHNAGEDVTPDLQFLLNKVTALKDKEQRIANGL